MECIKRYSQSYLDRWELNERKAKPSFDKNGFLNDSAFKVSSNGVNHPAYTAWRGMIKRVFTYKKGKYPLVKICDDWLFFSNFLEWWRINHVIGFHLDKDIKGCGDVYSPSSCVYVPCWLNNFILKSEKTRGNCKLGVSYHERDRLYYAHISINGIDKHLGVFKSEDDAHRAYLDEKIKVLYSMKSEIDSIDPEIFDMIKSKY